MNEEVDSERGHRVTLLQLDGKEYIVDVGFTAESQAYPIEISDNVMTKEYRVLKENEVYKFQILKDHQPFTFYTYTLEHYTQTDCEVSNFYSFKHQDAVFRNVFALSRITPETTYSLRNRSYHKIYKNETITKEISSLVEFKDVLTQDFHLDMDADTLKILFQKSLAFEK
jgi:N-hydroxyarylamine O-acetyltransferase